MYKLLLVDDEDIEREGMAAMVPWEKCGMELVGTAWNGIEGLEKIKMLMPEVVITDIKMPVMNGIELIRQAGEISKDTIFIVLSGYGEYEYTSQAMELGIRHYILKPCDESKIIDVLDKVRTDLEAREEKRTRENQYRQKVRRFIPRAKEQIFTNMLLGQGTTSKEYQMLTTEIGSDTKGQLLVFRADKKLDSLEEFALTNIMAELAGEKRLLLHSVIDYDIIYLLKSDEMDDMEPFVKKVKKEFHKFQTIDMKAAVSRIAEISKVYEQFQEIGSLFQMRLNGEFPVLLSSYYCQENPESDVFFFDYGQLKKLKCYEEILFEMYLGMEKLNLSGATHENQKDALERCCQILYGEKVNLKSSGDIWNVFETAVEIIWQKQCEPYEKEDSRMKTVLLSVYKNIRNQKLSIQYLAREVLFMNEDYLGRLFQKHTGMKYSAYMLQIRIDLAKKLIQYQPDIKVSDLAAELGYPSDGQYFAKVFKKTCGMSPSEYRESVKNLKIEP